ncbi:dimethylaniline monooxygenase [Plectosphaerella plurivora]|uniref:Dimethylaniline monooxygenase n=1 Tax=Plectosphaerella plurivora TaxID=936078 RepID=A0A9P8VAV8_9PEZI|nr:dimethylaniline monooxygenase [Plectosphaerella plurivora]
MFERLASSAYWTPLDSPTQHCFYSESDSRTPLLPKKMDRSNVKAAVIDAGPAGLSSLKELRDVGFDVTVFERRADVGGIFTFDPDPNVTSATPWTRSQLSKYIFNTTVKVIRRDHDKRKWNVFIEGDDQPQVFDKVVFCSGSETAAKQPRIDDLDKFKGHIIHGQAYKSPADYKGKNVVVLGMGNSASDTAAELTEFASKVYLAHRRGAKILPRANKDGPLDSFISWKVSRMGMWTEHHTPGLFQIIADGFLQRGSDQEFGDVKEDEAEPEWGLEDVGDDVTTIICSDHLIPLVREGKISSVRGIKRIVGPNTVELDDDKLIEDVDVIIACTGYRADYSILPDLSFTQTDPSLPPLPDLYQMVFALEYADSLACTNYGIINESAASYREIQSMAIAQVWAGNSPLPSVDKMKAQTAEYQAWLTKQMLMFPATYLGKGQMYPWMKFLHKTAGTGMYEHMGWGWRAMWFWLRDRRLYNLVAWGVYSPHMYRLFETGKRKAWPGARDAIMRVNEERERAFPKKGKADKDKGDETEESSSK